MLLLNLREEVILGEKRKHGNLAVSVIHYYIIFRRKRLKKI